MSKVIRKNIAVLDVSPVDGTDDGMKYDVMLKHGWHFRGKDGGLTILTSMTLNYGALAFSDRLATSKMAGHKDSLMKTESLLSLKIISPC